MLKSSLLEIIRTFSKEDLIKFNDFVRSPYHNKKSNVVKLFNAIKKFAPGFDSPALAKEEAWKKIFPGKNYNYGIMKNLIHDLNKLCENYLSYENFNTGLNYDRHLVKELFIRQSFGMFRSKLKKFERENESTLSNSSDYFYNKVFMNDCKIAHSARNSLVPQDSAADYKDMILYFMDTLFEFARMMYMEYQTINFNYDFSFIENIMDYFEKHPELLEESLIVKFRYLGVLFHIRNSDEKLLEELMSIFQKLKNNLSQWDKYLAYQQMFWAYEMMSRKQVKKYEKTLIRHMIEMVEQNIYAEKESKYVPLHLFTNIIFVCIRTKEGGLLKEFVDKNIHKLSPEIRESMLTYSYGNVSFLENDFERALYYFSKTDNSFSESSKDNFYFKYGAKLLILVSNYELNYLEQVLTEIDTFTHFLNNNKTIHDQIKLRGVNFVKLLKELTLLNLKKNGHGLKKLFAKINDYEDSALSRKPWLLEKIKELEKNAEI